MMHTMDSGAGDPRAVGRWLAAFAAMIFAVILIGGATRLTESGLSITEWKPVSGVMPPIGAAAWEAEFDRYKRIPQYERMNRGMSLDAFKRIYLWEYGHRLAARLIGLAFVLPLLWFAWRRRLPRSARLPAAVLLALLFAQAAMGWYMVKSGLSVRTEVSQYRLAAHLSLALALLVLTVWTAADLLEGRAETPSPEAGRRRPLLGALTGMIFLTAMSGALVAGLRAGRIYNTFPLMAGGILPPGYGEAGAWWRTLFEDHGAVQFHHRVLAITTCLAVVGLWTMLRRSEDRRLRRRMHVVLLVALLQVALGVATLLLAVPVALGVAHQGTAVLLLTSAVLALHANVARG